MMERRTLLGPYEKIKGFWTSHRMDEGTVRVIEGKLYRAEDDILINTYDMLTQKDSKNISKWILLDRQE